MSPVRDDLEAAVAILAITHGAIGTAAAAAAIRAGRGRGEIPLEQLLEHVSEERMLQIIGKERGIRYYEPKDDDGEEFRFDRDVATRCDLDVLRQQAALPLVSTTTGRVVVAAANPDDLRLVDHLRSRYTDGFQLMLGRRASLQNRLSYLLSEKQEAQETATPDAAAVFRNRITTTLRPEATSATRTPVQDWVDGMLERAVAVGASDINILMQEGGEMLLRYRQDGVMRPQPSPASLRPNEIVGTILSRCATMDPANLREPQEGKFGFRGAGRAIDARVALLPQAYGPTLSIRLLDPGAIDTRLSRMGFTEGQVTAMEEAVNASQGTILAIGPTGSGKSTTLYALLQEIDATAKNILTVENPIEYRLPGIGQTEIRHGLGDRSLTFARALRTILRADPDVILVGEIRDQETAETAMQAAVTGHLVLSTLHANTALGAYQRLSNMGVPAYLVAEAISMGIYQRLLRRLHSCAEWRAPDAHEERLLATLGLETPERVRQSTGCGGCGGTGHSGRIAVAEVLSPSPGLRADAAGTQSLQRLAAQAKDDGFVPIHHVAHRHVADGTITVDDMFQSLPVAELRQQWA